MTPAELRALLEKATAINVGSADDMGVYSSLRTAAPALLAIAEAAQEYLDAADNSVRPVQEIPDDVAAMLRYGEADTALRAALRALETV